MPADRCRPAVPIVALLTAAMLALAACGSAKSPGGPGLDPSGSGTPLDVQAAPAPSDGSPTPVPSTSASPSPKVSSKPPSRQPAAATNLASRLKKLPASTRQVIVVHGAGYSATSVTLEAFTKGTAGWTAAHPPMSARIGSAGFSDSKREGDKATPTGIYSIDGTMYGIAGNPGVRYAYHQLVADDWWNENSDTPGYNTFSHGADPGGPSEALWQVSPQYNHFAVIRYNMPATPGRGSGIFLHQMGAGATIGCVSLAADDLVTVLKWLDPAAGPRIVLSPDQSLGKY